LTVASLKELIAQKEALERQIEETRRKDRSDAVAKVRGLSVSDLSTRAAAKTRAVKGSKVAAKYRNPATGDSWSGRGLQPKWLKAALASGRKLGEFAV